MKRHPEIEEQDVIEAWNNFICMSQRNTPEEEYFAAVGFGAKGRALEMVAVQTEGNEWYVFHALTPPTKKILTELGSMER